MTGTAKEKMCKVIRVLTVAPLLAFAALTILYFAKPEVFATGENTGLANYLFGVLFLTVFPLLAYPLQPIVPGFRGKGREGQRNLAILMAVAGYVGATIYAFAAGTPAGFRVVALSYLFSGVLILVFNKVFHIRASGHACGVAGPVAYLLYFLGPVALGGVLLMAVVFWASLAMRRHTLPQLLTGALISVASIAFLILILL